MTEIKQEEVIVIVPQDEPQIPIQQDRTLGRRNIIYKCISFILDLAILISVAILYFTSPNITNNLTLFISVNIMIITCFIIYKTITRNKNMLIVTNIGIYFNLLIVTVIILKGENLFMIGLDILGMIYGLFVAFCCTTKKKEYTKLPDKPQE